MNVIVLLQTGMKRDLLDFKENQKVGYLILIVNVVMDRLLLMFNFMRNIPDEKKSMFMVPFNSLEQINRKLISAQFVIRATIIFY